MKSCLLTLFWGFVTLVALAFVLPLAFRLGLISDQSISDRKTTQIVLPTGEIVSNDSYLESGFRELVRHNQLYFQESNSAVREKLGEPILEGRGTREILPVDNARLFRFPDHLILSVAHYLFVKKLPVQQNSPPWQQSNIMPGVDAELFLRSFCKANDQRTEVPRKWLGGYVAGVAAFHSFPQYQFDQLSLDGRTLRTVRPTEASDFPQYIAFNYDRFDDWHLDLEATRAANRSEPPDDPHLTIEISVVTAPGHFSYEQGFDRDFVMKLPGAKEVYNATFTLTATEPASFGSDFVAPFGHLAIGVEFSFWDCTPNFLVLRWSGLRTTEYELCRLDEWDSSYQNQASPGLEKMIYFRVRKT